MFESIILIDKNYQTVSNHKAIIINIILATIALPFLVVIWSATFF
ncbi:protein of unknown function [Moritella yayanosii]|uniref:Uncharacterized protein n=1 Tax=Moritella yayanosii TaxID=69539 RepID=A0A330LSF9_9GAMM|nr:protein of unknown function [Moritella yayanosii]